ncbi:hypothetical protein BT96DRAFT_1006545 [Gymnopus androsaceus JB14]|uniref:Uncharacterized protein n=1 Tax=Gymnopus androsaceus JB14 TaxID=1447944 RepID=A0A6A4GKM0_9AGAR|nr:hypothetical protein BT96DRAFT_1006545 [Gymnopus androsaceus JB14]
MDDTPIGPMIAIPHSDMVDASQIHCQELENNAALNKVSTQTAAAIALCAPQSTSKPNYQPSCSTGLFARGDENNAAVALPSRACTATSAAACVVLTNITNTSNSSNGPSSRPSDAGSVAAADDAAGRIPAAQNDNAANAASYTSSAPDCGQPDTPTGPAVGDSVPGNAANTGGSASTGTSLLNRGVSDSEVAGQRSSAIAAEAVDGSLTGASPSNGGASDAEVAGKHSLSKAAEAVDGSGDASLLPRKKKRSEMGIEERRIMRQAAQDHSEKLSADVAKLLEEQEELFAKYAELNDVSVDRIKKLAHQLPLMKPQKKASDYNVLVYFKGKELNSTQGKGSHILLRDLHDHVKKDDDLQDIFNNPDAMKSLHQKYDEEKSEEKVAAIWVSKRAQAKSVAEKMNLFQQEADFLYKSSDANSFVMVVRGSFKSTVYFHMGVQDVVNLYESFVVTAQKVGTRKLYQTIFLLLGALADVGLGFLEEITGVVNLTMSYVSFAKNIVVPYKVNVRGWPDDVPRSYPQRLSADQTKRLYDAWNGGGAHWYCMTAAEAKSYEKEAEKNGELEPRVRKKRSDAGSKRGQQDDSGSNDSGDDELAHPAKGTKRKRAARDDGEEGSDDEEDGAKKAAGGPKKSAGGAGGAKKSARGSGKKSAGGNQKKSPAGVSRKVVGGSKKSTEGAGGSRKLAAKNGKGKKKSQRFVVSDSDGSDEGSDGGEDDDEDDEGDTEFSD